jgi:dTDP-4-dehydrorhamnose 3,5-epimerase
MRFTEAGPVGAYVIEPEKLTDERGFFARVWCARELEDQGLESSLAQASIAYNDRKNTLRGMHYQIPPHEEVKIVRCTAGAIFDAIVDLRPDSPTYLDVAHVVLSARNRRMLYVPRGFAHGYQTLENHTEVFYQMSEFYTPGSQAGIRWDDPTLAVPWPDAEERIISERDRALPLYRQGLRDEPAGRSEPPV